MAQHFKQFNKRDTFKHFNFVACSLKDLKHPRRGLHFKAAVCEYPSYVKVSNLISIINKTFI